MQCMTRFRPNWAYPSMDNFRIAASDAIGDFGVLPELSSTAIFAIGLGVSGVMRRYRQRKNGRGQ